MMPTLNYNKINKTIANIITQTIVIVMTGMEHLGYTSTWLIISNHSLVNAFNIFFCR